MSLNELTHNRTSMSDFVSAIASPDSELAYLDCGKVNSIVENIEHGWEAFQIAHTADGDHQAFSRVTNFDYVDVFHFSIAGDVADKLAENGYIILDLGDAGHEYTRIYEVYSSGSDTIVGLDKPVATSALEAVLLPKIRDWRALPEETWRGVYRSYSDGNLLNASGDWTGDELNSFGEAITKVMAFGHIYKDGREEPEIILEADSGGGYAEVTKLNPGQYRCGITISTSTSFRIRVSGSDGLQSLALGLYWG